MRGIRRDDLPPATAWLPLYCCCFSSRSAAMTLAAAWHDRGMTVVKINAITVPPDGGDELARRFAARAGAVDNQDGFEGFELLRPTDDRTTWLVVTRWRDESAFQAWVTSPAFGHGHRQAAEAAAQAHAAASAHGHATAPHEHGERGHGEPDMASPHTASAATASAATASPDTASPATATADRTASTNPWPSAANCGPSRSPVALPAPASSTSWSPGTRDGALGLFLVLRVRRVGRHRPLPPLRPLVAVQLAHRDRRTARARPG